MKKLIKETLDQNKIDRIVEHLKDKWVGHKVGGVEIFDFKYVDTKMILMYVDHDDFNDVNSRELNSFELSLSKMYGIPIRLIWGDKNIGSTINESMDQNKIETILALLKNKWIGHEVGNFKVIDFGYFKMSDLFIMIVEKGEETYNYTEIDSFNKSLKRLYGIDISWTYNNLLKNINEEIDENKLERILELMNKKWKGHQGEGFTVLEFQKLFDRFSPDSGLDFRNPEETVVCSIEKGYDADTDKLDDFTNSLRKMYGLFVVWEDVNAEGYEDDYEEEVDDDFINESMDQNKLDRIVELMRKKWIGHEGVGYVVTDFRRTSDVDFVEVIIKDKTSKYFKQDDVFDSLISLIGSLERMYGVEVIWTFEPKRNINEAMDEEKKNKLADLIRKKYLGKTFRCTYLIGKKIVADVTNHEGIVTIWYKDGGGPLTDEYRFNKTCEKLFGEVQFMWYASSAKNKRNLKESADDKLDRIVELMNNKWAGHDIPGWKILKFKRVSNINTSKYSLKYYKDPVIVYMFVEEVDGFNHESIQNFTKKLKRMYGIEVKWTTRRAWEDEDWKEIMINESADDKLDQIINALKKVYIGKKFKVGVVTDIVADNNYITFIITDNGQPYTPEGLIEIAAELARIDKVTGRYCYYKRHSQLVQPINESIDDNKLNRIIELLKNKWVGHEGVHWQVVDFKKVTDVHSFEDAQRIFVYPSQTILCLVETTGNISNPDLNELCDSLERMYGIRCVWREVDYDDNNINESTDDKIIKVIDMMNNKWMGHEGNGWKVVNFTEDTIEAAFVPGCVVCHLSATSIHSDYSDILDFLKSLQHMYGYPLVINWVK